MSKPHDRDQRDSASEGDPWPLLIEFALSLRGWWIDVCDTLDLTPTQGLALRRLDPDSPLAMSALAGTLDCDASNVTGVVDKLEARGLIARQGADYDRRVKVLVVTEKGREIRRKLFARASKPPAAIAALPQAQKDLLVDMLRALVTEKTETTAMAGTASATTKTSL